MVHNECTTNSSNAFCVTALPHKTLIATLVIFFTAKISTFILATFLSIFIQLSQFLKIIIPDDYYVQVLFQFMPVTSLKLDLMLR